MVVIQSAVQWHLQDKMSIPLPNSYDPVDIHAHYMLPAVFTCPQWTLQLTSTGEAVATH